MDNEIVNIFQKCVIFKGLNKVEINEIIDDIKWNKKYYATSEKIFSIGEKANSIGIIGNGCIEIKKYLANGNVINIFSRNIGEIIGGCIVFANNSIYPYDIIAKQESEVIFINKDVILNKLCKNEKIALNLLNIFANRIFQFERRLELFSYSSIQKKIIFSLLYDFSNTDVINLPFTKTTWAEYLNVSRPSLSRELAVLEKCNLIKVCKREIIILDRKKLEDLINEI